jgi:predicted Zn-dependent protease
MKRIVLSVSGLLFVLGVAAPVGAQIPKGLGKAIDTGKKTADTLDSLHFTDEEERTLGQEISGLLREKYGVVQDRNVHKYVTLTGKLLAAQSTRPTLQWTFIVLDTDGVNAFAAPGGFIHITRGALGLIQSEAELADVLGHEIIHVTAKHTLNAIVKAKGTDLGLKAGAPKNEIIQALGNYGYSVVLENNFDRSQEEQSDKEGVALANKVGYAPTEMGAFLTRLAERNKGLKERSGIFASHRDTQSRLDALARVIKTDKLTAAALVAPRFAAEVKFPAVPVDKVAQVAPPSGEPAKPAEQKSGGSGKFGLGGLNPLSGCKSGGAVSSAAARGVNPDRDAKGGPNKGVVVVTVTPAEMETFRGGIK